MPNTRIRRTRRNAQNRRERTRASSSGNNSGGFFSDKNSQRRSPRGRRRPRREKQELTPAQTIYAIAGVLLIGGLLAWYIGGDPPPPASGHHVILVDVSEGTDKKFRKDFRDFIVNAVLATPTGDQIDIAQITARSDAPTQLIQAFTARPDWTALQRACKKKRGKITPCPDPAFADKDGNWSEEDWGWRGRIREDGPCGRKKIRRACREQQMLTQDVKDTIVLRSRKLPFSPIVEALIFSDEKINDTPENSPEKRTIHIYSDMLQHTRWLTLVNSRYRSFIPFQRWASPTEFTQRWIKRRAGPFRKIQSNVNVSFIRRRSVSTETHVRNLKKFWQERTERPLQWTQVRRDRGGSGGGGPR